jgi:hypothetical protein
VKVDYPNDLWDMAATYKRIGEAFDPSLGFVPRQGVHLASASVNWQPRRNIRLVRCISPVLLGERSDVCRRPDGWLAELSILHGADQLSAGEW